MPQAIHQPIDETAAPEAGCSNGQSFSPKPKSYDYRGQRELNWGDIEVELANIRNGAKAVECLRGCQLRDQRDRHYRRTAVPRRRP